jgi:hypothetical protein
MEYFLNLVAILLCPRSKVECVQIPWRNRVCGHGMSTLGELKLCKIFCIWAVLTPQDLVCPHSKAEWVQISWWN